MLGGTKTSPPCAPLLKLLLHVSHEGKGDALAHCLREWGLLRRTIGR